MINLNESYWNDRYATGKMGWDIGAVSSPLKAYFDQLKNKDLNILIPGAGNAYEAEYLYERGFKNVTIIDISEKAIQNFHERYGKIPDDQVLHDDFFNHQERYDLIIEQTFFCALTPDKRASYVKHMYELLILGGRLVGVLFNIRLNDDKPPFGGHREDYLPLFDKFFDLKVFDDCYNSIPPRQGSELFINCIKK